MRTNAKFFPEYSFAIRAISGAYRLAIGQSTVTKNNTVAFFPGTEMRKGFPSTVSTKPIPKARSGKSAWTGNKQAAANNPIMPLVYLLPHGRVPPKGKLNTLLTSTFIHVRDIDVKGERRLWEQGATTWDAFLSEPDRFAVGCELGKAVRAVENGSMRLERGEYQYFASRVPKREHWRMFPEFRDSIAYLDIETSGSTRGHEPITVIGIYDGVEYMPFIKGENLADFHDAISHYSVIVTFFGGGFDLPVIKSTFPSIRLDQIHIDLCPLMRQVGYRGGLKAIERAVGIERSPETAGLNGRDAVRLWGNYVRGSAASLDRLLAYNREDVVNLEKLMELAYFDMRSMTMVSA